MKKTTSTSALRFALFAAAGAAACAWAPQAVADDAVPPTDLGTQADLGGGQQWTVTGLQPSADQIVATPAGALWEATATATPTEGGMPFVPGFAARTPDGQDYPVMWNVPTPLGINPSPLAAGESATGKLYFDVTGAAPDSVTYLRDGRAVAVWVQPPPPPTGAPATSYGGGAGAYLPPLQAAPAPVAVPRAAAPAAPAPAGSSGTPAPAAAGAAAPATGGSSGTPQPTTGSVGTPATPSSTPATPAPTTPAPASAAAAVPTPQASTSPAAGTAPAGGTPAPAAAPAPAPANIPLPSTGSSGTPFTVPTTTPVPVPAGQ